MKNLKIKHSKPPTERLVIRLLEKEAKETWELALKVLEVSGKAENTRGRVMFKAAIPKTQDGPSLAEIRNNVNRVKLYLRAILS
jgi:hypothetical protein